TRGLTPAASVQLTNLRPPGVTFVSASPSQGGCTRQGSELFCDLGSLSPGAGASVALLVHPTLPGPLTNTAIVGCELFDLNLTNNRPAVHTRVISRAGAFANTPPRRLRL